MTGKAKDFNILLVGNNPKEMADFYMNLSKFTKISFLTDVCFDLKESITLALRKKPSYILLDDNYPTKKIRKFIYKIRNNNKTQHIPVGILKSSNKSQILVNGIQDFFLKDNFNADRLFYALSNSRKVRRAQIILYKAYKRSRKQYQLIKDRIRNFTDSITF
jgi:CheY-like chemotaxis protein